MFMEIEIERVTVKVIMETATDVSHLGPQQFRAKQHATSIL